MTGIAGAQDSTPTPPAGRDGVARVSLFVAGVVLPAASLVVELATRWCAEILFDPIPGAFHLLLVAAMPIGNLAVLAVVLSPNPRHLGRWTIVNGIGVGISAFYSLLFAPVTPIAAIAIIWFGIGLLPLGPLFSLVAGLCLRRRLARLARERKVETRFWLGFLVGFLLLLGAELPAFATRIGLELASSPAAERREAGIRWLQAVGDEDVLLEHCYADQRRRDRVSALFIWSAPLSPTLTQHVFYRVTGQDFAARPAPEPQQGARGRWGRFRPGMDLLQGGSVVGAQLAGLKLETSHLAASFDAESAVAYVEWTLSISNTSDLQREARAQIALPPGAVISRVTLWIDGEEREAAFAGKREARAAYEKVVRRQRDPLLVTSAGQDRALVQLFPVPPRGDMKMRLGFSVPALLPDARSAALRLPHLHERNFAIPAGFEHQVSVEAKAPMRVGAANSAAVEGVHSFSMNMADSRLSQGDRIIAERRENGTAWAIDRKSPGHLIRQDLSARDHVPRRLIVVLDPSSGMSEAAPRLAELARRLPRTIDLTVIVAGEDSGATPRAAPEGEDLAERLLAMRFRGGHDNLPALQEALALATRGEDAAILWLHGVQPIPPASVETLLQTAARTTGTLPWYDLQVGPGANAIIAALDGRIATATLNLDDLEDLIGHWQSDRKTVRRNLERVAVKAGEFRLLREKTSDHLARLWAHQEIQRRQNDKPPQRPALVELAQRYQLVTPVSGAVVLENQAQYAEAGLEPVKSGTVPTIPEPEMWALISVALGALAWQRRRAKAGAGDATR